MSEFASLIPTSEQLLAQQMEEAIRMAKLENKRRESNYWGALNNWKLLAPLQQAAGQLVTPRPQPERLVVVDLDATGSPVLRSSADPVCVPEPEPVPVVPGLVVVVGDPIPGLGGYRAVGPGDTAPAGHRAEKDGKFYLKTASKWATFGGIQQCFYIPE